MEPISMDREYTTRDGREVRLYAVDAGGTYPIHGAVHGDGAWHSRTWTASGVFDRISQGNGKADLIPKPRKHTLDVWVNVYADGHTCKHATYSDAEFGARFSSQRIACVHVVQEYVEGEGLSPPPGEGAKE